MTELLADNTARMALLFLLFVAVAAVTFGVTLTVEEDGCCSLNALRSLPPDRIQKSPVETVVRPLKPSPIFGFHHHHQCAR